MSHLRMGTATSFVGETESSASETEPPLKKISVVVKSLMKACVTYHLEIDHQFSLLDLLQVLLKDSSSLFDESSIVINQQPKSLLIEVGNASDKLIDYVPENNMVTLIEHGCLTPKNDFLKVKNIVGVYTHGLEKTLNLPGDCLLNLAPLGSWIGFGNGALSVPIEEDNHIKYLIFFKYENKTVGYNGPSFSKMPVLEGAVLIPHLNRKVSSKVLASKLLSVMPNRFKIVELSEEDFQ